MKISQFLIKNKLIKKKDVNFFGRARDNNKVRFYRDKITKIIFTDYTTNYHNLYSKGEHYKIQSNNYERKSDNNRRVNAFKKYYKNKIVCDFGCGNGDFLKTILLNSKKVFGIELNKSNIKSLNRKNILVKNDINLINEKLDTIFLFHVLEHLPNSIEFLKIFKKKLKKKGKVIIEVPHACDILLDKFKNKDFINFTLWSQHLILHTKDSLKFYLKSSGYKNIEIFGIQRYNIFNHLNWLNTGKPGGHKSAISKKLNKTDLKNYEMLLNKFEATDTLIAIAEN